MLKIANFLILLFISDFSLAQSNQPYTQMGVGGGGAMTGYSISPYNSDLRFVATDMGLVYRSIDGANSWQAYPISKLANNADLPHSNSVGFAPDGKTLFYAQLAGCVPSMSTDGGDTWQVIANLQSLLPKSCTSSSNNNRIRYWQTDKTGKTVFAAGFNGAYVSQDGGNTWAVVSGLSKSSRGTFIDNTTKPFTIYHATPAGIYKSIDNGASFQIFYPKGIHWFAGGRDANGLRLVFIEGGPSEGKQYIGKVWLGDSTGKFTETSQPGQDWLYMAPNDSQTVFMAGNRGAGINGTQVWRSTDGAKNWTMVFQQLTNNGPWPASKFVYSAVGLNIGWWDGGYYSFTAVKNPTTGEFSLGGTGNFFLSISENSGESWNSKAGKFADTAPIVKNKKWASRGLEPVSPWLVEFNPANSQQAYVGYSDIGCAVTEDAGSTWRLCNIPGLNVIYDFSFLPNNTQSALGAASSIHDFPYYNYAASAPASASGGIFQTDNIGLSWTRLTPNNSQFNMPFLSVHYNPINKIIYAGSQGRGVAVSSDNGQSWRWLNTGIGKGPDNGGEPIIISQIQIDPVNGDVYALRAGDMSSKTTVTYSGVYYLKVGSTKWQFLRDKNAVQQPKNSGGPLWRFPTAFAVDWTDPKRNTIWVSTMIGSGAWNVAGLWLTQDRGKTFTQKLYYGTSRHIYLSPTKPGYILVAGWGNNYGAMQSIVSSTDYGNTWQNFSPLPAHQYLSGVTIDPNNPAKAFYTSFGGGIFYGPIPQAFIEDKQANKD